VAADIDGAAGDEDRDFAHAASLAEDRERCQRPNASDRLPLLLRLPLPRPGL
jgi:hypothetical protein